MVEMMVVVLVLKILINVLFFLVLMRFVIMSFCLEIISFLGRLGIGVLLEVCFCVSWRVLRGLYFWLGFWGFLGLLGK